MPAESPDVTTQGLSHIDNIKHLRVLALVGLVIDINDALLKKLHQHNNLTQLVLGHPRRLTQANITAPAVIESVREGRVIHTHTGSS